MRPAILALLWLLYLASTTAAQPVQPSITDAELEVLCSFESAQVATGLTIDDVQARLASLTESERKAKQTLNDEKSTAAQRASAQGFIDNLPQQRKSFEQTLHDMTGAEALRGVHACAAPETRKAVCAAYNMRRPISWAVANEISQCMRSSTQSDALRELAPPRSPRALTGTALESAFLRGTAEFIVERGEQELAMFAAQVMSRELCSQTAIASLLSNTCALIFEQQPEEEEPIFAVTLAALREAVRADLSALPTWLSQQLGKAPATKPAACALEIAWGFSERVLQGADVAETLWDLQAIVDPLTAKEPCRSSPQLVQRLTDVLAVLRVLPRLGGVDVGSGDLDLLVSRAAPDLTKQVSRGAALPETELNDKGTAIREVLQRLRELQRAIETLQKDPSGPKRAAAVLAALRTIEPLLDYAGGQATRDYIATVGEIVENIGSQRYIPAVIALADSRLLKDALGSKRVGRNFRVLITLSATIAQAESSDAVKAALEEAAAPLQSWRRKDIAQWGATITGLPGFALAYEQPIEKTNSGEPAPGGATFAPTLMLGVDVHHGLGGSRLGVLFNVLDLGAVATIRLEKPKASSEQAQAEQEPDLRFEQVFAPGLYPYFGYGPFDFGLGVGFVPSLRPARDSETRDIEPLNVLRFGGFIAVDVSILPLF